MNTDSKPAEGDPADPEGMRLLLSALSDGEASSAEGACRAWRDDARARATWHTYHLIGDVLRSDDLAAPPVRDAAFLAALRVRLADEPVPLAPARLRRRQLWLLPTAAAAGFVAVAGVMVVARNGAPGDGAALTASRAPDTAITLASSGGAPAVPVLVEGRLIRDPQLDRYLRAHRSMFATGAMTVPGGSPRSVEVMAPSESAATSVAR